MRIKKLHYVFSFIFLLSIGLSEPIFAQQKGKIQKGSATWYGAKYHGRKTSSGEVYNKNHMTAAHPTLPFGTKVKVTNSVNNQTIVVRINDRGPFGKKGYIIDLSEAAARKIGLHQNGFAKVSVEVLTGEAARHAEKDIAQAVPSPVADSTALTLLPYFVIQAGSFADQANAQLQSEKLKALQQNLPVTLNEELVKGKKVHRVVAGHFASRIEAEAFKAQLQKKGISVLVKQMPATT